MPESLGLDIWMHRATVAIRAGTTLKLTLWDWADLYERGWRSLWDNALIPPWTFQLTYPPWMLFGVEVEFVKPDEEGA